MDKNKIINAETFISESQKIGPTYRWAISVNYNNPNSDYILYYPHVGPHQRCPYLQIHKSKIHSIEIMHRGPCYINNLPTGNYFIANVTLNRLDEKEDAELLGILKALAELADIVQNPNFLVASNDHNSGGYSCGEKKPLTALPQSATAMQLGQFVDPGQVGPELYSCRYTYRCSTGCASCSGGLCRCSNCCVA